MRQRKYNILFLGFVPYIGGAEISTLLLLKYMDKERFNPIYIIPDVGPLLDRIRGLGVKVLTIPLKQIKLPFPSGYLRTVWKLAWFIKKNEIDLVICTNEICNQYGLPASKLNCVPIASHTRNLILDYRSFWRMFLHFPDVLIANSKATAESYSSFVRKNQRIEIVYNGVDLEEYSPSENGSTVRKRYGIGDNKFLIGMISRITRTKRQDVFIKAMAEVVKIYPDVCALIIGETKIDRSENYLEELQQLVKELKIGDKVIFTGFIDNMKELYESIDLLVLPSLAEPFGRVLIEAMAMEKPVIATRAGGAAEIVENGVTGLLVPPDDINGLAKAIVKMLEDEDNRKRMGKAGRKRVENMFSIEKNVGETQRIYLEILNKL